MHKHKIWQHCLAVFFIVASYLALLWVGVNIMVAYAYESSMCPLFVYTFAEKFPHFKTLRENALKRHNSLCYTLQNTKIHALFVIKTSGPKQSKTFRSSEIVVIFIPFILKQIHYGLEFSVAEILNFPTKSPSQMAPKFCCLVEQCRTRYSKWVEAYSI